MTTSSRKHSQFSSLLVVALLSCCATLVLSSCSKSPSAAIIGKWQMQGKRDIIEFRKDGTLTSSNGGEHTENGTYSFTDANHMKVEINVVNDATNIPIIVNCTTHIQDDALDLTTTMPGQSKPDTVHLKRIK